jgi:autotransporter-associated beta strand protein
MSYRLAPSTGTHSVRENRSIKRAFALAVIAASLGSGVASWADTYGSNGGTPLNLPASWIDETVPTNTGIGVPGATDIAAFDSNANLTAATSFFLGAPTSWKGILIQSPGAGVTLGADGNTLTLGASGIDMSAATQNLTLAVPVTLGASQSWNVAAAQTLTASSTVDLGATGTVLTLTGSGNKVLSGVLSDAGGIKVTGGTVTLSNANTYTGTTSITRGNLLLDFSSLTTASNIVSSSSILSLGGNLTVNGNGSTPVSQTFASTTLAAGQSQLQVTNPGAGVAVNLGAVTRAVGSGTNFIIPTGATLQTSTGTANTLFGTSTNTFGIVNGTDWAAKDSTNTYIVGASTISGFYGANPYGTSVTLPVNVDFTNPTTGTAATNETRVTSNEYVNTIRFNAPNTGTNVYSLTVKAGAYVAAQGVLVTANVGTTNCNIDNIRSNAGGSDLVIWQNDGLNTLTLGSIGSNSSNAASTYTQNGIGTVIISTAGTYTGQSYLNGGITSINTDGAIGAPASAAILNLNGGTLQATATFPLSNGVVGTNNRPIAIGVNNGGIDVTSTNVFTVPGVISGVGSLTKTNTGTLLVTGSNTYTGGTFVNAGKLQIDNTAGSATGTGPVTVAGGTLSGIGTASGNVNINTGGSLIPGDSGVGTLTAGSLTFNGASTSTFYLSGSTLAANQFLISGNGTLTINGTDSVYLYQPGTTTAFSTAGTYALGTLGTGGVVGNLANFTVADVAPSTSYTFANTGGLFTVTIANSLANSAWAADVSGLWGTASNWNPAVVPTASGDVANFPTNLGSSNVTVTLATNRTVGTLIFGTAGQSSPLSYTVAAGGGTLTLNNGINAAIVTDLGGSHVIAAPVSLGGNVTITSTNDTASGTPSVLTFSGNISDTTGNSTVSINGTGTVIFSGTNTYSGTTTISPNATLQLGTGGSTGSFGAGNVTNNSTLVLDLSGGTLANNIAGNGTLNANGTGVLQLSGNNTFTGPANINTGTVQLGSAIALGAGSATNLLTVASGATLDLNGNSSTVGSLSGAGTVNNTGTANVTLTTGVANASPTFSGVIENTGNGSLALTKVGTGSLTLSAANTYSGGTTINAGSITVANNGALGSGVVYDNSLGGIQLNNGVVLSNNIVVNDAANEFVGTTGNATLAGNITTTNGTQYRLGSGGTLVVTGTSTVGYVNGGVNNSLIGFITRGNVIVAGNGVLNELFQPWSVGRSGATTTLNLTIQDNGVVMSPGVNLGGADGTSDDATTTVVVTGNGTLNAETGTLNLNNSGIAAGGVVNLTASGNSTLEAASISTLGSSQGQTTVNFDGGTILATAGDTTTAFFPAVGHPASAVVNILAGGLKVNDGGFAITIAQPLSNGNSGIDGGLTKLGNGSLTLTAANTYTGTTSVSAGKLYVNNTSGSGTGTGNVILNGGTLGGTGTIAGTVVAGTGAHTINPGLAGSVGTLTIGGLTTDTATTLAFDLTSPTGTNDLLAVNGNVTLAGGTLAITSQATTGSGSLGYYPVISYTGTLTGPKSSIVLPAVANNVVYTLDTTQNPGYIDIHRGFIGDANDDGKVDLSDLNIVLNNLGSSTASWGKGNFDSATTIDLTDLNDVLNHLGTSIASTSSVVSGVAATPEPASLGILALGAAALIARRRKA